MSAQFYELEAETLQGKTVSMQEYAGKTVLVVNTATKCGLAPQFDGLEKLYQKYKDRGLVVLGFPSNQFANQEPGDAKSIEEGCRLNYGVTFPMFAKIHVNGRHTHPIFQYLKGELKGTFGARIKWNFTKFLVDESGKPIKRFGPNVTPEKIDQYLQELFAHEYTS